MNPTPTVSASYTQVRDLHISRGLGIRLPSKAAIGSRAYYDNVNTTGGYFNASQPQQMMSPFFRDVDSINITGGYFNTSQPQHNGKWALVDERRH